MNVFNHLRYNHKYINYMTNNFTLNNFFATKHEMGVIIITPRQVAISYRKMGKDITHREIIQNMLKALKTEKNNPTVVLSCYSYSNKSGGCFPDIIRNRLITQEMYEVIDKIYQKLQSISNNIDSANAKEFVEMYNLKICNFDIKDEKIVGINLQDFIKKLDVRDLEEKELPTMPSEMINWIKEKWKTIQTITIKGRIKKNKSEQQQPNKSYVGNKLSQYKIENSRNRIEQKAIQQQEKLEGQKIDDNQKDIS